MKVLLPKYKKRRRSVTSRSFRSRGNWEKREKFVSCVSLCERKSCNKLIRVTFTSNVCACWGAQQKGMLKKKFVETRERVFRCLWERIEWILPFDVFASRIFPSIAFSLSRNSVQIWLKISGERLSKKEKNLIEKRRK